MPDSSRTLFGGIGVILTGDHHQARRCVKATGTSVMARRPTPLVVTKRTPNATAPDGTPSLQATRAAVTFSVSCTPPCCYKAVSYTSPNSTTAYGAGASRFLEHKKNPPPSTTRTFATRISWCHVIVVILWETLLSTPCYRVAPQKINISSSDGAPKSQRQDAH
jgi:hypothetical protein